MNELIQVVNGEVIVDSRMIAEHFNKRHGDVIRDIRDECVKLEAEGVSTERIFALSVYYDTTGRKLTCYTMDEDGALQLAARYDAVSRRKLIVMFKELRQQQQRQLNPLEILELQLQQMKAQERKLQEIETKVDIQTKLLEVCRDNIIENPDEWRENIVNKLRMVQGDMGGYQESWHKYYDILNSRAGVNLKQQLENARERMKKEGVPQYKIDKLNKLDIVERDKKLKEIATKIANEIYFKYKGV
jgi:Rha family phage regulatory protein